MPDYLDTEHAEVLRTAELLADELAALSGRVDESDIGAAAREASKAAGVFGMTQPMSVGGTEAGALALAVVRDTLGSRNVGHLPGVFGPSPGVLADVGEPLRSQFLLPYLAGEIRSGFGFTEPADAPRHTWARRDGDDLVVNGAKS